MRTVLFALAGLVGGAAAGFAAGLGLGLLMAQWLEVTCFEGACGYFVVMVSLVGGLIGAVGGAVWLGLKGHRPA